MPTSDVDEIVFVPSGILVHQVALMCFVDEKISSPNPAFFHLADYFHFFLLLSIKLDSRLGLLMSCTPRAVLIVLSHCCGRTTHYSDAPHTDSIIATKTLLLLAALLYC